MKKIITLLTTGLMILSSCVDLDQRPQSFITEEDFMLLVDAGTLQMAVSALYKDLWYNTYGFSCRLQSFNVCSDELSTCYTKQPRLVYLDKLNPVISVNGAEDSNALWIGFYNTILNANKLIHTVVIPDNEEEAAEFKKLLGEAYFVRGLCYFYLVRLFGDVPKIVGADDAVPSMPRSSVESVYLEGVIPSFEQAIEWLPATSRSGDSSTPTVWAAKACLAETYLHMAGWPLKQSQYYAKAAEMAEDVMDHSGLYLTPVYSDLWLESKKTDTNEHMFALHHSAAQAVGSEFGKSYVPMDYYPRAGWADYFAEEQFYLDYPEDDRKVWNFMTDWPCAENQIINYKDSREGLPAISKFYDYTEGELGQNSPANGITPIMRYANVLLTYAEASVKASGSVGNKALKALNDVQQRANSTLTTTTIPAEFEKAVFDERGWEFFAEMKRWFELVRLEKVAEKMPDKWEESLFKQNNSYYMPIPQTQIDLTNWENNLGY